MIICAAGLVFTSCKKKGCTDANASNYSEEATKDDGDCQYEATLTLWYDQASSIAWDLSGVTTIDVFVGGVDVADHPVGTYETIAPTCAALGTINTVKNLGASATSSIDYEFKDQNGASLLTGTWSAVGGECTILEVD